MRRPEKHAAYKTPPRPIPNKAMARMRPNVKVEAPSGEQSIRYQTISISRNANPAMAEAAKTNAGGAA